MPHIKLDRKKCNLCGTCIDICPMGVFEKDEKEVRVQKAEECIGCRACEAQCEQQAIKVTD